MTCGRTTRRCGNGPDAPSCTPCCRPARRRRGPVRPAATTSPRGWPSRRSPARSPPGWMRGRFLGPRLAETLADLRFRRVLDIGGSSGVYLCALIDRQPNVRGAVFERPPVDVAARTLLAERGYT